MEHKPPQMKLLRIKYIYYPQFNYSPLPTQIPETIETSRGKEQWKVVGSKPSSEVKNVSFSFKLSIEVNQSPGTVVCGVIKGWAMFDMLIRTKTIIVF